MSDMANKLARLKSLVQRHVPRCNCCRLGTNCLAYNVHTRRRGDWPGSIQPEPQKTWLEQHNIDVTVTDVAEKICLWGDLYRIGGFTPDGKRWVERISYDTWWRNTWNYGKLQSVK